ncbi:MAG: rhodanese-like domain-containing protein [Bacteroidota bacterium]
MRKYLLLICTIFTLSLTGCLDNKESKAEVRLITAQEMQDILELEDVQLVDVRSPQEYEKEHIARSQNIDFRSPTFDEDIKKLDKDKPVILYCKSGKRSAKCVKKLEEAGFEKIYELEGGISKWKHADINLEEKS